jgi:hypothetical protein
MAVVLIDTGLRDLGQLQHLSVTRTRALNLHANRLTGLARESLDRLGRCLVVLDVSSNLVCVVLCCFVALVPS